jgi:hypothetical protein
MSFEYKSGQVMGLVRFEKPEMNCIFVEEVENKGRQGKCQPDFRGKSFERL